MKKGIVCCSIMILSLFLFSCTSENESLSNKATVMSDNNENDLEISGNSVTESSNLIKQSEDEIEGEKAMELITVERFMEIYDLTPEDVGEFNLQGMITDFQLTEENMKNGNWKAIMETYKSEDINCGYNIADKVYGKGRYATAEDDISSIKWLVMDNTNALYTEDYIWDVENKKSYFSNGDIMYDYSKAEIFQDLSEEEISQMVSGLVNMNMSEWEGYYGVGPSDEGDYYWNLFVVLKNGDVLYYRGCQPELSGPEGFYDWLQEVIRVSKGE